MKSTFRILFYVKRDKQKSDGTFPIMCRITIDGVPARFNTKVSVNPSIWDAKSGTAIRKSNEAVEVNTLLNGIKTSVHNVYHDLLNRENNVNAEKVKNIFLGIEVKHQTVLELFQRHNDDIAKLVGISKSKETHQKYEVARTRMASFAEKIEGKQIKSKSELDKLFECLSLGEKMALFNLPPTLSNDPEKAKPLSIMWHSLSEEEKSSLWTNTFESEDKHTFKSMATMKIAVNQ